MNALIDSPLLAHIEPDARAALAAAARAVELAAGAAVYREGDDSDGVFLVESGSVAISAVRRGDQGASLLRLARAGDSFGEEALLVGLRRRAAASATEPARVVEIPIALFQRLSGRGGDGRALDREWRYLERAAARDLLAASALGRGLGAADGEILLDGMRLERFARGARLFEAGESADRCYILVDGLVQIQSERRGRTDVAAYLGRGDLFGDEEALAGRPRSADAVAAGDSWCAVLPADVLRTLSDRNPGLIPRLRRVSDEVHSHERELVASAAARSTQHVFRDLYRMQMARSLLVIDQDRCVRCGHCAWSCGQVHGVSRLVRRGDKVVTRLAADAAGPASLLLPNTCQHCRHAACMIDCPTGAIGRDREGEVFIRPDLCTGCGNCAKACPWDNIQMAPRPGSALDVAVKCDLCRGYEAPACVEACPQEALTRLDPGRDIAEVAELFGARAADSMLEAVARSAPQAGSGPASTCGSGSGRAATSDLGRASASDLGRAAISDLDVVHAASSDPDSDRARRAGSETRSDPEAGARSDLRRRLARAAAPGAGPVIYAAAGALAIVVGAIGWARHESGGWSPGHGPGLAAGLLAGIVIAALAAYAVPKRLVRRSMRRRRPTGLARRPPHLRPPPRSRMRPHLIIHIALGLIVPALALAHAGARLSASPGGALAIAMALAALLGAAGALAYRILPRRLTRLERRGALPEDLIGEREALLARLYREISGTNDLTKTVAARLILPYTRARLGWLALALSGHGLTDEEEHLRRRIDVALEGRGQGRLDEVPALVRTAVELRALPARRAMTIALSAWLPLHIVSGAVVVALLLAHLVTALLS